MYEFHKEYENCHDPLKTRFWESANCSRCSVPLGNLISNDIELNIPTW